jgi:serine/threonine-protein kinase HipA
MRQAAIYLNNNRIGTLSEDADGYLFAYTEEYVDSSEARPISLTLPLSHKPYRSNTMFPFFDGLIPEGWLLDIAEKNWKIDSRDRMALLLACCKDCIGAVSVEDITRKEDDDV